MKIQRFPFSQDELKRNLLVQSISDHQIVSSIKSTQRNFTVSRDKIEMYSRSELDVSSYSLFYMPTDFPKLSMVLSELSEGLLTSLNNSACEIYDIGCGPGTFSYAWRTFFPKSDHQFYLIDQSPEMLKQAMLISRNLFDLPAKAYLENLSKLNFDKKSDIKRVAIFGHSINEMGLSEAMKYIDKIGPDLLIMLGPGTPSVFKTMMNWRDKYSGLNGYEIKYPCLSDKFCPMIKDANSGDWCHQILREKLSPELHQLGQKMSIDRRSIAFIGHVYLRKSLKINRDNTLSDKNYCLVRFLGETKFSWQYLGCSESDQVLVKLEVMKKMVPKADFNRMSSLLVGQRILFDIQHEVSSKHLRGVIK